MKKTIIWIAIGVVALGGIGFLIYKLTSDGNKKGDVTTVATEKDKAIAILINNNSSYTKDMFKDFEEGFLIAWAKASDNLDSTFLYNSKTYDASTGNLIK